MSGFTLDTVEALDYDFRGFDSNTGKGKCKGHGTIPEPTTARLEAYQAAVRDLTGAKTNKEAKDKLAKESDAVAEEKDEQLLILTADLCQNTPSVDDLKELRPRARTAFIKWVYRELADPEVSRGDTAA